ncbi:hypothetical protein BVX97_02385 [bacterium E08(2017)]|nr:hypothetical protein BVX97_02385 [bacterium E08(2017)]
MELMKRLLVIILFAVLSVPVQAQNRAQWLQDAKWGVMIHYQRDWLASENNLEPITMHKWNELADAFDCEGLAQQLADVGAGYLIFTVHHAQAYFLAPNKAYDKYSGRKTSRCTRRDLIADLSDALNKHGIKLIAYLPGHPPIFEKEDIEGFLLGRSDYYTAGPFVRNAETVLRWQEVIKEYSLRWGDKVSGWWIDACYRPNTTFRNPDAPNFESMAAACRAGNPEAIVCFNPGRFPRIMSITPYEDYTAGEINHLERIMYKYHHEGMIDGKQIHILSFLGKFWGQGKPRFSDEEVVKYSADVNEVRGAITWDCPVYPSGLIKESFMKQLALVGKALK